VAGLERDGRLVFSEMDPRIGVEEYVHSWDPEMEAALARGFDAVWCARFPVGPDTAIIDRSISYDRAWEAHAHDRRYVSLCIYVVGDLERDRRAAELAPIHDTMIVTADESPPTGSPAPRGG
jgi:hypothetical protein